MSPAVPASELAALIAGRGVLRAAGDLEARPEAVTFAHAPRDEGRLIDGDTEGDIEAHRAAHAAGRPSEATLLYGSGVEPALAAARLAELADLAGETGMLRAVCPTPGEGSSGRPGSWGVEDLGVIVAARVVLPRDVDVRPDWRRLGPAACQIAIAFGATDWLIPAEDATDPHHLAAAVGARAVER